MVEKERGTVGARLRAARRGAGLTQKQLAAALGVESVTVSRWERDVSSPSLARLRRIAEVTATRIDDLVPTADTANTELAALRAELAETRELVERVAQALERLASPNSNADSRRGSRQKAT